MKATGHPTNLAMTCSFPGTGRALVLTCALLANGVAQTSHWIAPVGAAPAQWTDPANWDNGVPNHPDAVAVVATGAPDSVPVNITGTTVELGELRLEGLVRPNGKITGVVIGSLASRGELVIGGPGYTSLVFGASLSVQNGNLAFRNSAVASGSILITGGRTTVQFSDSSVFRGRLGFGFGGSADVTFSGHSSLNGGEFSLSNNGGSEISFRDDAIVHQGTIRTDWGVYNVAVHDRADLSGLALRAGRLVTAGGAIYLNISAAAGPVRLDSISGYVPVTLGANTLVFGSAPAGRFSMDGAITGTGGLRFESSNAGTVWITSPYNTYTGDTYVGSVVNLGLGSRLSAVRIAGGGRLVAEGSFVSRSLSVEDGTLELNVAPRFVLIVEGSYTQSTAGVLALPVSVSRGLLVTGAATLGGQLDVISLPVVELGTQRFPILSAGSISGTFARLTGAVPQTAMLQSRLEYAADRVTLLVEQQLFGQVPGASPAAAALGKQIDRTLDTATGSYRDWLVGLNQLATSAEVAASLAGTAPDRLSVLPEQAFAGAAVRAGIFRDQLRAGQGAFVAGLHGRRRWESSRGLPRVQSTHNGGLAGAAFQAGPVRLGVYAARERGATDLDASDSTANDASTTMGLGFHYARRKFFLTGSLADSAHKYRWQRIVPGAPPVTATGATRGRQQDWELGAGHTFVFGRWQVTAEAGVLGSRWQTNRNRETGAEVVAYEFDRWKNRSLRSRLGLEVTRASPGARWQPYAGLHWWHEFEPDRTIRARLPAAGGEYYTAPGRRGEIDEVMAQAGMNWHFARSWTAGVGVSLSDGRLLRRADNYTGSVRWQF